MCASTHLHIFCSVWHIERVGQEYVAVEAEAEAQEEQQLQEFEVAEEDQEFETNLANPDLQQGKPQFIDPI